MVCWDPRLRNGIRRTQDVGCEGLLRNRGDVGGDCHQCLVISFYPGLPGWLGCTQVGGRLRASCCRTRPVAGRPRAGRPRASRPRASRLGCRLMASRSVAHRLGNWPEAGRGWRFQSWQRANKPESNHLSCRIGFIPIAVRHVAIMSGASWPWDRLEAGDFAWYLFFEVNIGLQYMCDCQCNHQCRNLRNDDYTAYSCQSDLLSDAELSLVVWSLERQFVVYDR